PAPAGSNGSESHSVASDGSLVVHLASTSVPDQQTWTLNVDGQAFSYKTSNSQTLTQVAGGLTSAINGNLGYTATSSGTTITIRRATASFFARFAVTPDSLGGAEVCTVESTCASNFLTAHWPDIATADGTSAVVHFTGTPAAGEAWALTLPTPFSYTAPSGATASSVAAAVASLINGGNAGFTATA